MSTIDVLQFLNHLKVERNCSRHTLRAYMLDLQQFCDFLENGPAALRREDGAQRPPASLDVMRRADREKIRALLAHVQPAGATPRTSARTLAAIRAAYTFFTRTGRVDANPAMGVRSPRLARDLPDVLTIPEVTALVEAPDLSEPLGLRDRTMLELMYASGLRVSELVTLKTFNVSSAAAIVAAACGVTMTRHGSRALTSFCGTVDILEAIGVDVECDVAITTQSIREVGIGLYNGMSTKVHPAALGRILSQIRFGSTLNIAASLANPARPTHAVRGVYSKDLVPLLARVMPGIGYHRGMVVHGQDHRESGGMDELSITGPTLIQEFTASGTKEAYLIHPDDLGLKPASFSENGACADFTHLNAAAILYTTARAGSLTEGIDLSHDAISRGAALFKLQEWVESQATDPSTGKATLDHAMRNAGLTAH